MARVAPIRTEADHRAALARINELIDAQAGTRSADELAVLADLVAAYEAKHFPIGRPTPIDAIRFRMEQAGLEPRDLEPYIGSRGKVSDVLAGKQPLTLSMIRALHRHLDIPAEVLLNEDRGPADDPQKTEVVALDWSRFPINEMIRRNWVHAVGSAKTKAEELVGQLIESAGGRVAIPVPLCRRNDAMRQNAKTDIYALLAWCLKALSIARSEKVAEIYRKGVVDLEFLSHLAKLSADAEGLRRVKDALSSVGVHFVCLAHLPKTYLDGAALRLADDGAPVVALTLRYDRLDNFWFSLFHELAHVGRHFNDKVEAFVDDFSLRNLPSREEDKREDEADEWANEALIPEAAWHASRLHSHGNYAGIIALSQRIGVHPAIVAGRIRHETRNFRAFAPLLGAGEVRKQLKYNA
jgi:HTH-type transcriptional regulator / antitoxin HigA